jgi:hypothetical protein
VRHEGGHAPSRLAEQKVAADPCIVEAQFGGVLRFHPELVQLAAAGEAGRPVLDDE